MLTAVICPPIPTPPETTSEPVEVEVDAVLAVDLNSAALSLPGFGTNVNLSLAILSVSSVPLVLSAMAI